MMNSRTETVPSVNWSSPYWGNQSWENQSAITPSYAYEFDEEAWRREKQIYAIMETITIVCYVITIIVGTVGNVLVIYTIWRCRHLHTVMYTLLASLSIADLIMLVLVLPWNLKISIYFGPWLWGEFMCRVPSYVHLFSAISSVFHLSAISMERCYAVMFPLKSRTKLTVGNAYKIIAIVWIGAALLSIPQLFSYKVETFEFRGELFERCRGAWTNPDANRAFILYKFFIVFAIPLVQITGSYAFIIRTIYIRRVPSEGGKNGSIALSQSRRYQVGSTRSRNGTSAVPRTGSVYVANNTNKLNRRSTRNKEAEIRQMTVMLVVVIILFALCWGPILTFYVFRRFYLADEMFMQKWIITGSALELLSVINSAVNPIIYALLSVSFRDSCIWALKVCCKSKKVQRRMSAMSRASTVSRPGISTGGGSTVVDNVSESSLGTGDKL